MQKPKTFPGQGRDEEIHLFLRRFWLSFLPTILIIFVMLLIPIFIFLGLRAFGISLGDFKNVAILGTSCYLLFVLAFFISSFIDYYLDVCIVTNQRIVDIEQHGLFNRVISEQDLIRVQDVTAKKQGVFQTFFDFGNVFIQTAGEAPNFEFMAISKPNEVTQTILKLQHDILAKGYQEPEEKPPLPPKPSEPPKSSPSASSEPQEQTAPSEEFKEIPKI